MPQHKLVHAERTIECAGCSRMFVTESAMLLHLEIGTCTSGADRYSVLDAGRQCYRAFYYVSVTRGYPFQCPTCETPFSLMSGLVQHVESDHCDECLDEDRPLRVFLNQLRLRLSWSLLLVVVGSDRGGILLMVWWHSSTLRRGWSVINVAVSVQIDRIMNVIYAVVSKTWSLP